MKVQESKVTNTPANSYQRSCCELQWTLGLRNLLISSFSTMYGTNAGLPLLSGGIYFLIQLSENSVMRRHLRLHLYSCMCAHRHASVFVNWRIISATFVSRWPGGDWKKSFWLNLNRSPHSIFWWWSMTWCLMFDDLPRNASKNSNWREVKQFGPGWNSAINDTNRGWQSRKDVRAKGV